MIDYRYSAINPTGESVHGSITAASRGEAVRALMDQSLSPLKVQAVRAPARQKRIRNRDLESLYSNLADLLDAGVPLVRAIELLVSRSQNNGLTPVLREVRAQVANGSRLSEALADHPNVFSLFTVNITRAGEEGGFIEESLRSLAVFTERSEEVRGRILGAIAYPAFLVITGGVLFFTMMVFFVPRFQVIFERLEKRGELPLPTIVLLQISDVLKNDYWYVVLLGAITGIVLWRWLKTDAGGEMRDRLLLRIWGIGKIIRQYAISRFCRVLGTMLKNGVPIMSSLEVSRHVTGNIVLSRAIAEASKSIAAGRSLAGPLSRSKQFSEELIELIHVGETTNRLDEILMKAGDSLERQANRRLDLYIRMLEPALLLIMAIIILFLLLALLLPVLQSAGSLT
ncbi:type II secretion system F family protein [bacterium]|nr:type II secretion system F family protein [Rhodopirellula sp.]MDB4353540.1 type II secretion system F family protein [bacterium]MDB4540108.1 type II secretion system F family protein [bacterium]